MFQHIALGFPADVLEGLREILIKNILEVIVQEDSWGYTCSVDCDIWGEIREIVIDLLHASPVLVLYGHCLSHLKFEFPNVSVL